MKQKGQPKYNGGEIVTTTLTGIDKITIERSFWNGFVWMYYFKENETGIGEEYIIKPKPVSNVPESVEEQDFINAEKILGFNREHISGEDWENVSFYKRGFDEAKEQDADQILKLSHHISLLFEIIDKDKAIIRELLGIANMFYVTMTAESNTGTPLTHVESAITKAEQYLK